ncbi:protein FAM110B [Syngnathus typhle]|uniref:protein FAM110B n=1 Tax=Syngnathus typhle TaxID=161592 RepID=UPI002A6AA12F|nr:protein FAM110B [Syngnathus typhle]XP_061155777.1 protein FAM110B [Syngnathus typhle]XP_061155783.1 protein FAM110B [Syngnathus typhle]
MPVEVKQSARPSPSATFPRLRPKRPVGPEFYRQSPPSAARPKQSAVERLEADKAKYVKSQVALSKQQPVRSPDVRKSPLSPVATTLRPAKKTPGQPKSKPEAVQLDLEHLSSLISDVSDGPTPIASSDSVDSSPLLKKTTPGLPSQPHDSSSAKVKLKAAGWVESPGSPTAGTVRRVDVIPQASPSRTPRRPPLFLRQPLQPLLLHPQFPLRPTISHLLLRAKATPSPLKPVVATPKRDNPASSPLPVFLGLPPPSPAVTPLSGSPRSRKRPSLTRSKSDMSEQFSRAGTELERFFNLCGLDPAELQDFSGAASDMVSLARFRSVSAPGSECAGSGGPDEDGDDEEAEDRVPYGVSVIERNARVIKWLYGLRQAK